MDSLEQGLAQWITEDYLWVAEVFVVVALTLLGLQLKPFFRSAY